MFNEYVLPASKSPRKYLNVFRVSNTSNPLKVALKHTPLCPLTPCIRTLWNVSNNVLLSAAVCWPQGSWCSSCCPRRARRSSLTTTGSRRTWRTAASRYKSSSNQSYNESVFQKSKMLTPVPSGLMNV